MPDIFAAYDYANTISAAWLPNGSRIIRFTEYSPFSGVMIDRWVRDDGRQYLGAIINDSGRSPIPRPKPGPGHIEV